MKKIVKCLYKIFIEIGICNITSMAVPCVVFKPAIKRKNTNRTYKVSGCAAYCAIISLRAASFQGTLISLMVFTMSFCDFSYAR